MYINFILLLLVLNRYLMNYYNSDNEHVTPQMDITRYSINHEFSFGNPNII